MCLGVFSPSQQRVPASSTSRFPSYHSSPLLFLREVARISPSCGCHSACCSPRRLLSESGCSYQALRSSFLMYSTCSRLRFTLGTFLPRSSTPSISIHSHSSSDSYVHTVT